MALASSSGAAATAIVYLAHNGNSSANWMAVCMQFTDFFQAASGAVVSSFVGVAVIVILHFVGGSLTQLVRLLKMFFKNLVFVYVFSIFIL